MNEQIKELAKQCYETGPIGKDGWPEYTKFNEQKFAELIVRECEKSIKSVPTHFEAQDKIIVECLKAMKKHFFGVEE
jgi:hypothetical protein